VLDERKRRVLHAVVDDYVRTATPVGSRTIARRYDLGVSPATIRNEMADLEDMGYLEQPHTSAGRIPSDKGYRFYVDSLMEIHELAADEMARIKAVFEQRAGQIELLIQETGRLISDATDYLSLIVGPKLSDARFKHLQVLPLSSTRALLILVTDVGVVEHRTMELPEGLSMADLTQISWVLSDRLKGCTLEALEGGAIQALRREIARSRSLIDLLAEAMRTSLIRGEDERLYLGGTRNILNQPEFRDVEHLKLVLGVLEQADTVQRILSSPRSGDWIGVSIGEEIEVSEMHDCSLVTTTYLVGDRPVGRIGVLGPKRMEYARVVALVREVRRWLSDVLTAG